MRPPERRPSTRPLPTEFGIKLLGTVLLPVLALAAVGPTALLCAQDRGRVALPAPTGPRSVGVAHRIVTDPGRDGGSASAGRELPVVIWYPAERGTGDVGSYLDALDVRAPALDREFVEATSRIEPNARSDARPDPNGAPYPVVVVSHSLGGVPGLYSGLGEELASRGYVVVSVGHPGGARALAIGDTVVTLSEGWAENDPARVGVERAFEFREARAQVWATDALFVLSRLPTVSVTGTSLTPIVDTSRTGYVGHSVGGSAAAAGCTLSARFDACVNLDGWPLPPDAEDGLEQPYLHAEETRPYRTDAQLEEWGASRDQYDRNMAALAARKDSLFQAMEAPSYHLVVDGLTHEGFSDRTLWDESARERQTLDPDRGLDILRSYLAWFLGRHVRGQEELRPPDPAAYPEVRFTAYGAEWIQDRPATRDGGNAPATTGSQARASGLPSVPRRSEGPSARERHRVENTGSDTIAGTTIRWTWTEGPVAGTTHEHEFREDGTVEWQVVDGPGAGHSAVEETYVARRASDDVYVISYLASSGYTLTVALNFANGSMVGFASNSEEWYPGGGTFEVLP